MRVEREGRATQFPVPDSPDRPTKRGGEPDAIRAHIAEVGGAAAELLADVNRALASAFVPSPLVEHYADERALGHLRGVTPLTSRLGGADEYLLVTGEHAHYFWAEPRVLGCAFHTHAAARAGGKDNGVPIVVTPSTTPPRAFFTDGQRHHCAWRHRRDEAPGRDPIEPPTHRPPLARRVWSLLRSRAVGHAAVLPLVRVPGCLHRRGGVPFAVRASPAGTRGGRRSLRSQLGPALIAAAPRSRSSVSAASGDDASAPAGCFIRAGARRLPRAVIGLGM